MIALLHSFSHHGSEWNHQSDWGETAGRKLHQLPWMDGAAAVLRRDATKVRVFDGFFGNPKNGLFGFFWDPVKNLKIAQCAYPIDSFSAFRVKDLAEDSPRDRCSRVISVAESVGCPPSQIVHDLEAVMCGEEGEEGFVDGMKRPSCLQQMLEAKANAQEYTDFWHKCPTEGSRNMDCSHTEVIINRNQTFIETEESPRATGWVWAHKGPALKSVQEVQGDEELQQLLCRLHRWDAKKWQPTGYGLEQPRHLLQVIMTNEYAGDTKADDLFDLIDLEELCHLE